MIHITNTTLLILDHNDLTDPEIKFEDVVIADVKPQLVQLCRDTDTILYSDIGKTKVLKSRF